MAKKTAKSTEKRARPRSTGGAAGAWPLEWRAPSALTPYPQNPRDNDGAVAAVAASITAFGFRQPIVVDAAGVIVVGHTRLKAAIALGLARIPVHVARDLTPAQLRAYRIADNKTCELASWNLDLLSQELIAIGAGVVDWATIGFGEKELVQFLAGPGQPGLTDPDDVPAARATTIRPGDLFELGLHRLLCGDSTKAEDVARAMDGREAQLVATSPPYGGQRRYGLGDFDWDAIVPVSLWNTSTHVTGDGSLLVNLGLIHQNGLVLDYWRPLIDALADTRPLFGWYVWDKLNGLPGDWNGRLSPAHEWVFHFAKSPRRPFKTADCKTAGRITHKVGKRSGLRGKDDEISGWTDEGHATQAYKVPDSVIRCQPAKGGSEGHPAPFSVEFAAALIEPYAAADEVVIEPFSGSGTTIIACEQLTRRCVAIDIEPAYCQVAIDRWEAFTGQKAKRIGRVKGR